MFLLLGIAYALVVALAAFAALMLRAVWKIASGPSATIQVMTWEEQERFVEHARARAWKELYLEVGNG